MKRLLLAASLLSGACALPHGPDHGMQPLEAFSLGLASGLHADHARTGMNLAVYSAGTSRVGSYASLRVDAIVGLDLLLGSLSSDTTDSGNRSDTVRFDEYEGAVVYTMGGLFRLNNDLALYGGVGLGNLYRRDVRQVNGQDEVVLHALNWGGNLQGGLMWSWTPELGLDVGYDSFDDSWRLAFVARW